MNNYHNLIKKAKSKKREELKLKAQIKNDIIELEKVYIRSRLGSSMQGVMRALDKHKVVNRV